MSDILDYLKENSVFCKAGAKISFCQERSDYKTTTITTSVLWSKHEVGRVRCLYLLAKLIDFWTLAQLKWHQSVSLIKPAFDGISLWWGYV